MQGMLCVGKQETLKVRTKAAALRFGRWAQRGGYERGRLPGEPSEADHSQIKMLGSNCLETLVFWDPWGW